VETRQRIEISAVLVAIFGVLILIAATTIGLVRIEVPAAVGDAFGWVRIAAAAALVGWVFVKREVE